MILVSVISVKIMLMNLNKNNPNCQLISDGILLVIYKVIKLRKFWLIIFSIWKLLIELGMCFCYIVQVIMKVIVQVCVCMIVQSSIKNTKTSPNIKLKPNPKNLLTNKNFLRIMYFSRNGSEKWHRPSISRIFIRVYK